VARIARFRRESAPDPSSPIGRARIAAPVAFERMVRFVEWKLIQMPLPRVQQFGHGYDPFLYQIHWDRQVAYAEVRRYQRGEPSDFDSRISLRPGVGEHLVLLNGLLRPLIHRQWAALLPSGRLWAERDADLRVDTQRLARELPDNRSGAEVAEGNLFGRDVWESWETATRTFLGSAEAVFRARRDDPAFDFSGPAVEYAKNGAPASPPSSPRVRLHEPWPCPRRTYELAVMRELFEWDPEKAEQNRRKHGVSLSEASTVFRDPLAITLEDNVHSDEEQRYLITGRSSTGRILVVAHAERGRRIRLITARPATAHEKRAYEQED
jgi:uncharacterized protein